MIENIKIRHAKFLLNAHLHAGDKIVKRRLLEFPSLLSRRNAKVFSNILNIVDMRFGIVPAGVVRCCGEVQYTQQNPT